MKDRGLRLSSIDSLRGIAALAVVLSHATQLTPDTSFLPPVQAAVAAVLSLGFLGVPLFFVISGFCIHLQWVRGHAEDRNYSLNFAGFWKRRLFRLYPPYFVALVLTMLMVYIAYRQRLDVPLVTLYPEPRGRWMLADFFAHVTMLFGLHPVFDQAGGNSVYWTLAREEYFYLLYLPLLFMRRHAGLLRTLVGVLLFGFAVHLTASRTLQSDDPWLMIAITSAPVLWIQWCLGMLAVEHHYGLVTLPRWCSSILLFPLLFAGALLAGMFTPILGATMWGLAFFNLVMYSVSREATKGKAARSPGVMASVGMFSYSLYLVHYPIRAVIKTIAERFIVIDSPTEYWGMFMLVTAAGIGGGYLFYVFVERRFVKGAMRLPGRASTARDIEAAATARLGP